MAVHRNDPLSDHRALALPTLPFRASSPTGSVASSGSDASDVSSDISSSSDSAPRKKRDFFGRVRGLPAQPAFSLRAQPTFPLGVQPPFPLLAQSAFSIPTLSLRRVEVQLRFGQQKVNSMTFFITDKGHSEVTIAAITAAAPFQTGTRFLKFGIRSK